MEMCRMSGWLLLVLLTVGTVPVTSEPTRRWSDIASELHLPGPAMDVVEFVKSIRDLPFPDPAEQGDRRLLTRFEALTDRIRGIDVDIGSVQRSLRGIQNTAQTAVQWENTVETMENLLRPISSNYDRFLYYQRNSNTIERHTLEEFAVYVVSHDPQSLQSTMSNLHHLVKGPGIHTGEHARMRRYAFKKGLFRELKTMLTSSSPAICDLKQSPQQLAFGLHGIVALALTKGYAMIQFSYMLLRQYKKGEFSDESRLTTETYERISFEVASEAQTIIKDLPNVFWRCNPKKHVENSTFVQLTELLQGYLENEEDMNPAGTCKHECANSDQVKLQGCYKEDQDYTICPKQRQCHGTVHECKFYEWYATVCFASGHDGAHRRYDGIQFTDGPLLGRVNSCQNKLQVESWRRLGLFWLCSYCFCLCDDDRSSDRYFSLIPAAADVAENKVVTGVRIVKKGKVFYIQIEQGTANKSNYVDASSIAWKPIENTIKLGRSTPDKDYMKLSWGRRAIDLDDLRAPDGHVVTGVGLRKLGGHLNLLIQVTPISASTAKLTPSKAKWIGNSRTPSSRKTPRHELNLGSEPDVPTRAESHSWPDSTSNTFVNFRASSIREDVAQTTIPFLDSQPVAPRPAIWLTGIGVYHKGQSGYGGFVGIRVETLDLTSRITTDV